MKCQGNMCCCNCTNQGKVHKHPWNKTIGKGAISEVLGYTCNVFGNDQSIFFEKEHGECEMFNNKIISLGSVAIV